MTDAIDQVLELIAAATQTDNVGAKAVYLAEGRARLSTIIARTEAARLQLAAIESELARTAARCALPPSRPQEELAGDDVIALADRVLP